jgi:hypothetical protein
MSPESLEAGPEKVLQIGPDRVTVQDYEVVIDARHPMPDWDVREINPVPIYFMDQKFYLVERRKGQAPFATRYVLKPWTEDQSTTSKLFHVYDEETVREREGNRRGEQGDETLRMLLLPFYPLLGLLWSGMQKRLTRFGFVPHSITGASVFTGFCLAFGQAVFAVVLINATLRTGKLMIGGFIRAVVPFDALHLGPVTLPIWIIDALFASALIADVLMRYSLYLRDDQWAGGFLEWIRPSTRHVTADEAD